MTTDKAPLTNEDKVPHPYEDRHEKHQAMLDRHRARIFDRREDHRLGRHKFKPTPNSLV